MNPWITRPFSCNANVTWSTLRYFMCMKLDSVFWTWMMSPDWLNRSSTVEVKFAGNPNTVTQ